ncbi:MAG: metal-dependent hydrolase [Gammaproteobacteria bacterium]
MDPLTQGVTGAAAAQSLSDPARMGAAVVCGVLAGMAPDLDALIRSDSDPLLYLEYHRQFTHALVFIPFGALLCAVPLGHLFRRVLPWRTVYLFCFAGYATHGLLDACTSYGTQLLWPFSSTRVAWHTVSIIDPVFSLSLAVLCGLALWRRRALYARAAVAFSLLFMTFGAWQRERAEAAGLALAAARGHAVVRASAKPSFANLLVWKHIYEAGGRYYVDAVRLGREARVFAGTSVPRLDVARDLPWLDPASQQARDIERFRWFSDDHLALDPAQPDVVVDMRYSLLPNEVDALWGIVLDRAAAPEAHVDFAWMREVTPQQRARLLALLRGEP